MKQPSTIKDVAKLAQCGVATVSRVLNSTGPASAETKERVLDAVEKLKGLLPDNFSLGDLALKWILMHDEVSVVIPGATDKSQVQLNAQASELEDISSLLPKINSIYDELIKPDVHHRW